MELLKEINDGDIYSLSYQVRKASRCVVFNADKKIALLYVSKDYYHKLPGGGIEDSESIQDALHREVLEEVGATIEVKDEVGFIIEYRNEFKQIQMSYCFIGNVIDLSNPKFSENEINHGFRLIWVTLDEAINLLTNDHPKTYVGKFIQERDLTFLQKVKEILYDNLY